jgi:tyrosine-protein kinase Etk/Wzc
MKAEEIGLPVTTSGMDTVRMNIENDSGREVDMFELAILLRHKIFLILATSAVGFLIALLMVLNMKPIFSSTAVLLVPQSNPSASSLALEMAAGGLDLAGGGYEIYEDILRSRTVADRMIARYQLKQVYQTKDLASTRTVLAKRTLLESSKEGLVRITVEDTDPKRAADIANTYLEELDKMNQSLAITSAGQQRVYFEREMVKEKDALADAEVELKKTQEKTGILVPQNQALASLNAAESTRAQIRFLQVQLGAALQGATEQNPEVVRLRAELSRLEGQLQMMQTGGKSDVASLPNSKAPEIALDNLRKAREVKFHETLFEMLARQYEVAKQNEAKTISMIEVLDRAIPAEHKSWPPRTLFCLLGLIGGGVVGVCLVLAQALLRKVMTNPENRRKFREVLEPSSIE